MLTVKERLLNRRKMLHFLEGLARSSAANDRSLYLPAETPEEEANAWLKKIPLPEPNQAEITKITGSSKNGVALFWGEEGKFLVLPPFPLAEKSVTAGYHTAPLQALLTQELEIALILVRLGFYAIGVCRGDRLISGKAGTGLVHGRHKKGGSSQARFRRHREKQIESFLTRVCAHAREQLEAETNHLDYLIYGGAWTTILSLQKRCPFLQKLTTPTLPALTAIAEPRRAVLEKAIELLWSSRLLEWHDDGNAVK